MTETSSAQPLSTLRLAELQQLAGMMGLKGTSRMRKSELVAAIRAARSASSPQADDTSAASSTSAPASDSADKPASTSASRTSRRGTRRSSSSTADAESAPSQETPTSSPTEEGRTSQPRRRRATAPAGTPQAAPPAQLDLDLPQRKSAEASTSDADDAGETEAPARGRGAKRRTYQPHDEVVTDSDAQETYTPRRRRRATAPGGAPEPADQSESRPQRSSRFERTARSERGEGERDYRDSGESYERGPRSDVDDHLDAKAALMRDLADATGTAAVEPSERRRREPREWDDDDSRGGRRRRGRKRREGQGDGAPAQGQQRPAREDEVLLPVAGILDVADGNHAYLRTSGYLPGPKDVYVSGQLMKDSGLRAGDAIQGWVREGGENNVYTGGRNNRRQGRVNRVKFNPLVSVETVNGMDVERAKRRPEFAKLTPLYPQEQLRLETTPKALTPRVIDLVSPIGKGQRGLIVSPPKAGKTIVLQQIANAIAVNNPEAHLMVVLVDERPEEVTDMQRTVKGEVIASTFDRPASDHTTVAELAIERAKRLVELGQDVVVLLDSITRLGRAYNLAAPASGRILSGGVDASALYPPKRFFGAARNIEKGGSLTILATALVETGSKMDEVIFEEFKGTGNMELRLSRQLAEKRIFPAVDVQASSTRREELLINPAQLKIMWRLRRLFSGLEQQQALEMVLGKLKDTQSNAEFLMAISKTTPQGTSLADGDDEATVA